MKAQGFMTRGIAVPEDLYRRAAEFAARDHVSVEHFMATLIANAVAGRDLTESRASLSHQAALERALNHVPDAEPDEYDRI